MHYGMELPNAGVCGDPRTLAEFDELAEAAGWDGVFLEVYIMFRDNPTGPAYDPAVALAAMALRTSRVRLGTLVTPLARRRPWKVAREFTTLDYLSGGRERRGDWEGERDLIASIAEAGATWWIEYNSAADEATMRERITRGPLRAA